MSFCDDRKYFMRDKLCTHMLFESIPLAKPGKRRREIKLSIRYQFRRDATFRTGVLHAYLAAYFFRITLRLYL